MPKPWHQRQKDRGVKLILTWFEARKRWKKYHEGKVWYFKHPNSAEGYEAAVAEYYARLHDQKETRPLAPEYRHHIDLLQKCREWYDRFGTPGTEGTDDEDGIRDHVLDLKQRLVETLETSDKLPPIPALLPHGETESEKQFLAAFGKNGVVGPEYKSNPFDRRLGSIGWELPEVWQERLRQLDALAAHQRKQPQTVGYQVQRFLDFKERQVRGGVIKARTWGTLKERLKFFVDWIKPGTHVATIDGNTVTGFYEWVLSQRSWQHQRAKGIFNTARQWIRWAWRQDDVELETLPRNVDSREFVFLTHIDKTGVTKQTRTELLWTPDDFYRTFQLVPEEFQLYLLLMLNCGFTNIDVATLLKSEIRLDERRIVRQRTKTRRHSHPPVVNYLLWPETVKLLRARWSDHPTLALTNRAGNPLGVSKLVQANGQTAETMWTGIGRRYGQMKKAKREMPDKQLKFLRKTGSTKLKSKQEYRNLDSLYLGHSWATVADKHYNAFDGQPYEPLDKALKWLGKEFEVSNLLKSKARPSS